MATPSTPDFDQVVRYYRAALCCLQYVEARRPTKRRFGREADALWKAFRGHLGASDRVDLLLRDANAEWPSAFGARGVFSLANVAEEEAFGASWTSLDAVRGNELWRELEGAAAPESAPQALERVAQAWGLTLTPMSIAAVDPAERLVVAGPSAIAAAASVFAGHSGLDWADQVTCIASPPAHRQLAFAALAVVDTHKPCRVLSASEAGAPLKGARVLCSDDASAVDLAAAQGSAH